MPVWAMSLMVAYGSLLFLVLPWAMLERTRVVNDGTEVAADCDVERGHEPHPPFPLLD